MHSVTFKRGTRVFHAWAHPDVRPDCIDECLVAWLGLDGLGVIMGPDINGYWKVKLGPKIVEWRENLIRLAT